MRTAERTTVNATAGLPAAGCRYCLTEVEVRDGRLRGHIRIAPSEYGERCPGSGRAVREGS